MGMTKHGEKRHAEPLPSAGESQASVSAKLKFLRLGSFRPIFDFRGGNVLVGGSKTAPTEETKVPP